MYDRGLVISNYSYCLKVPSTGTGNFGTVPVPWYYFRKVPSTGTAV